MSQQPVSSGRHNLFFALSPGVATRAAIAAAAHALRDEHPDIGRWINPPRYHMTLLFLGAHDALPGRVVTQAIEAAMHVKAAPFAFPLGVVGSFGARRMPVWFGCNAMPPALRRLHDGLETALRPAFPTQDHAVRFVPHVTIVRDATRALHRALDPPIVWPVDEFALIDSEPPNPYRVIARWPLHT